MGPEEVGGEPTTRLVIMRRLLGMLCGVIFTTMRFILVILGSVLGTSSDVATWPDPHLPGSALTSSHEPLLQLKPPGELALTVGNQRPTPNVLDFGSTYWPSAGCRENVKSDERDQANGVCERFKIMLIDSPTDIDPGIYVASPSGLNRARSCRSDDRLVPLEVRR